MRENRAVFCEMGKICPWQNAQPRGAKFSAQMRISATNGVDIVPQFCDGKIPSRAMMYVTANIGCMFACGWPPPAFLMAVAFIVAFAGVFTLNCATLPAGSVAGKPATGESVVPAVAADAT